MLFLSSIAGCSGPPQGRPDVKEWVEFTSLVDGTLEIQVAFPYPAKKRWTSKIQFAKSETNKLVRIFKVGYDPGYGKMDGAMWVYMFGSVIRIEKDVGNNLPISFEDIMQTVYLSHPERKGQYDIVGGVFVGSEEWYRVNYTGQAASNTVSYYKPISNNYALLLSMNMFGAGSDRSTLFQERHHDLLKVLSTVKVTVADFSTQ